MDFGALDEIPAQIRAVADGLEGPLVAFALQIMGILFTVQLLWGAADLLLSRTFGGTAGVGLADFIEWFTRQTITVGVFAAFVRGWSQLTEFVIGMFAGAANTAGGFDVQMSPSAIITTGANLTADLIESTSLFSMSSWVLPLLGLVILGMFVVMAAIAALVYAETYFVTSGAIAFMGYAGSGWSRPAAWAQIRYVMGAAAKVFVIMLLLGMYNQLALQWVDVFEGAEADLKDVVVALALALFAVSMAYALPRIAQAFVSGSSMGYVGSAIQAASVAAMLVAGLGSGIGKGIERAIGSTKLALEAKNKAVADGAGAGKAGMARIGSVIGSSAMNAIGAMAEVRAAKLSGAAPKHASALWAGSRSMQKQTAALLESREKQQSEAVKQETGRRNEAAEDSRRGVASQMRAIAQEKRDERAAGPRHARQMAALSQRRRALEAAKNRSEYDR